MAALLYTTYEIHPQDTGYVIEHAHYDDGTVQTSMQPCLPGANPPAAVANYAAIITKAQTALTANQTFLTNAATVTYPLTQAEQTALVNQVIACTRQTNAIIYYLLHALTGLNTITGT